MFDSFGLQDFQSQKSWRPAKCFECLFGGPKKPLRCKNVILALHFWEKQQQLFLGFSLKHKGYVVSFAQLTSIWSEVSLIFIGALIKRCSSKRNFCGRGTFFVFVWSRRFEDFVSCQKEFLWNLSVSHKVVDLTEISEL